MSRERRQEADQATGGLNALSNVVKKELITLIEGYIALRSKPFLRKEDKTVFVPTSTPYADCDCAWGCTCGSTRVVQETKINFPAFFRNKDVTEQKLKIAQKLKDEIKDCSSLEVFGLYIRDALQANKQFEQSEFFKSDLTTCLAACLSVIQKFDPEFRALQWKRDKHGMRF